MSEISKDQVEAYLGGKAELHEILELEPDYVEQLRGRAQFFVDGGHVERALIMLGMLEELDRTDPTASLIAAELLLAEGSSDAAAEKIGQVLERDPNNADALVASAELKIATGQLVPAAKVLEKVISIDPEGKTAAGSRALAVATKAHSQFEASA